MMGKIVERMRKRERAKHARQQLLEVRYPTPSEMEEDARLRIEALNAYRPPTFVMPPSPEAKRAGLFNLWGLLR